MKIDKNEVNNNNVLRRVLIIVLSLLVMGNVGAWVVTHSEMLGFRNAKRHLHSQHIFVTRYNFIDAIRKGNKENVRDFISLGYNAGTQIDYHAKPESPQGKENKSKAKPFHFVPPLIPHSPGAQNAVSPHTLTPAERARMVPPEGTSALLAAIDSGNGEILAMVMATVPKNPAKRAIVVNLQDSTHRSALIAAVEQNNAALVNQLLSWGADPALINNVSESPLTIAIKNKYTALEQPLLDADRKMHPSASVINIADDTGNTPLTYAIQQGDEGLVKTLLAAKADAVSPNLIGVTPLMAAEQAGNFSIARLLLDAGAKPDTADKFGNTPLTIAIARGNIEFAQLLLHSGADPDYATVGKLPLQVAIEAKPFHADFFSALLAQSKQANSIGDVLLFSAVESGNTAITNSLLARGISPQIHNANGETLLYHALESGQEDIALMLIAKGADTKQTGIRGVTPMESAIGHNEIRAVEKLLSLGASATAKNSKGIPLATMAMYLGEPEIMEMLVAHGASIENDKNFGLVYWAARNNGTKMVALLLEKGANPDAVDSEGNPALWLAASAGPPEMVEILIKYHAALDNPPDHKEAITRPLAQTSGDSGDVASETPPKMITEIVHHYGIPPLSIACRLNRLAIVKQLVAAGAALETKDSLGMTPLAHAAFAGNPDIVEYLLSKGADKNATDTSKRSVTDLAKLSPPSDTRTKVLALLGSHP